MSSWFFWEKKEKLLLFLASNVIFSLMQDLALPEILVETEKRGSSFDELLTIPEQDDWVYTDGKSTSCVAFILEMYKEAGLFGPSASSIQGTEFTVSQSNTEFASPDEKKSLFSIIMIYFGYQ